MEFVTFELAKKLKEKGFREKCFATYTPYSGTLKFNEINVDKRPKSYELNIEEFRECYNYYVESNIDAPTIAQVLKWLRDKGIHIQIVVWEKGWYYEVWEFEDSSATFRHQSNDYASYEGAAIKGVEYVLDKLI